MRKDHIPSSSKKYSKLSLDWQYITIHNTGNPNSTAKNERAYLTNPNNTSTTGFHIVIDDKEAIECIPLNIVAWHAGDGQNGPGNRKSIGIEFCESGDFEKTFRDGAKLVAELLKSKGYGIDRIKRHKDWSVKECPRLIIPRWGEFISLVDSHLSKQKWQRIIEEKMSNPTEWIEAITDRIEYGKANNTVEKNFAAFIEKLGG